MLCTRGYGKMVSSEEAKIAEAEFAKVGEWMTKLVSEARIHGA
jgi:hypothetical protein